MPWSACRRWGWRPTCSSRPRLPATRATLEAEADELGYKRLVAAGYDPREAPKLFKLMMDEVKASGEDEPFFFSTHPALKDRYDNYLRLSKDAPPPQNPPPDHYLATFAELRLASLETEVSMARYKQVIALLKEPERRGDYPPYVDYYLGEAYRQRGDKGDDELMKAAYRKAIAAAPDFAPAHRALGMQLLKAGAYDDAIRELENYLSLAQGARTAHTPRCTSRKRARGKTKGGKENETPAGLACGRGAARRLHHLCADRKRPHQRRRQELQRRRCRRTGCA